MSVDPKKELLEKARGLEKAGQADAAVRAFRAAGAMEDAARVLAAAHGPAAAGKFLMEILRVQPAQVGQLDPAGKKRALMAAIYLGKAGEQDQAVQLFMSLGEQARAVELLQRAGDKVGAARLASMKPGQFEPAPLLQPAATAVGGQAVTVLAAQRLEEKGQHQLALETYVQLKRYADAARMAAALGQHDQAAQLWADAGQPFEAAEAYLSLGDTGKALDNLTRVPREDPRYRTAAAQAVRLGTNLGALDFRLEHFLGAYVKSGPQDSTEVAVFNLLAQLYVAHGFPENAREVLEMVLKKQPGRPGVKERLQRLDEDLRVSAGAARHMLHDAELHRRRTVLESAPALPDLGNLPDLDGAPPAPRAPAPEPPTMVRQMTGEDVILGEAELVLDDEPAANAPSGMAGSFTLGATIAGRYKLAEKIGQGGMASVFKAWDLELEEHVALKVFGVQHSSEILLQRFKQELKLSRQLQHPNVIRLYDIGVHEGHRYLSMELLLGKSLKERLGQRLPIETALGYLIQACHGLQAAHDAGVVHRDVKPDNFFVSDDGVLKVMDFGIAKQHAAPGVTVAGSIAGTPMYMSPEQISNFSSVTHLTDLYALGICAYELVTGKPPFEHAELVPLLMMHVNQAPEPPRKRNPAVPPELEAIILRLLEKDPARRHQSCRELASELSAIRDRPRR